MYRYYFHNGKRKRMNQKQQQKPQQSLALLIVGTLNGIPMNRQRQTTKSVQINAINAHR